MSDLLSSVRAGLEAQRAELLSALKAIDTAIAGLIGATLPAPDGRKAAPPAARKPAPAVDAAGRPRPAHIVAREAALVAQARKGPTLFEGMLAALPKEAGQTEEQRRQACANALYRLKQRNVLDMDAEGRYVVA